jgi:hypothetical protein
LMRFGPNSTRTMTRMTTSSQIPNPNMSISQAQP